MSDSGEAEFDVLATWTADAVAALGPDHAVPAACRGSGGPGAIDWLARELRIGAGDHLLDAGAGVGGPAAHLQRTAGATPILAEPMAGACRAARSLFGHAVAQAAVEDLPFRNGGFGRVWCIGVLCTVDDLARAVASLARVTSPGGRIGLLVYVRTVPVLEDEPETNHFPSPEELDRRLAHAGLAVVAAAALADVDPPPAVWDARADAVDRHIERVHGADARWEEAHVAEERVGRLLARGDVEGRLLVVRRER